MRFSPIFGEESKGRRHLGDKWARKQLRGVQCILNATHGVAGPKLAFFRKAFGSNIEEFNRLLWMPENYIIYRNKNIENGNTSRWAELYLQLSPSLRLEFHELISDNVFVDKHSNNHTIAKLLTHYNG